MKALTSGEGLDVCVENVGGTLFAALARLMRWNGRLMPIGFTGGEIPSLAMNLPLLKNYSIVGVFAGAWGERFPDVRIADVLLGRHGKLRRVGRRAAAVIEPLEEENRDRASTLACACRPRRCLLVRSTALRPARQYEP